MNPLLADVSALTTNALHLDILGRISSRNVAVKLLFWKKKQFPRYYFDWDFENERKSTNYLAKRTVFSELLLPIVSMINAFTCHGFKIGRIEHESNRNSSLSHTESPNTDHSRPQPLDAKYRWSTSKLSIHEWQLICPMSGWLPVPFIQNVPTYPWVPTG